MKKDLVCLYTRGGFINSILASIILYEAQRMIREQRRVHNFDNVHFQGRLETTFSYQTIGRLSGFKFLLRLELEQGDLDAAFLTDIMDEPGDAFGVHWEAGSPF